LLWLVCFYKSLIYCSIGNLNQVLTCYSYTYGGAQPKKEVSCFMGGIAIFDSLNPNIFIFGEFLLTHECVYVWMNGTKMQFQLRNRRAKRI